MGKNSLNTDLRDDILKYLSGLNFQSQYFIAPVRTRNLQSMQLNSAVTTGHIKSGF